MPGWSSPAGMPPASPRKAGAASSRRPRPAAPLLAQMSPPDRVTAVLAPIARREPQPGPFVFDFGRNFSGWVRLHVQGPAGSEVTLRFSEEIHPDGTLYFDSTGGEGSPDDQLQRDVYILNGGAEECYAPRFTWHTFRYVEVTGYPGVPPLSALDGCVVHSAMSSAGEFTCSNELIDAMQTAYRRTQLANYHGGVPSDCPHRERLGYTGDGQLTAEAAMLNFDCAPRSTASGCAISPTRKIASPASCRTPRPLRAAGGAGVGIGLSHCRLAALSLLCRSARAGGVLSRHRTLGSYLGTRTDAGGIIVREEPGSWCLGDWSLPGPAPLGEDADPLPALVNTAYYGFCARLLSRIAAVLGQEDEAHTYAELAETIARNFHQRFYDSERGCYGSGRHGTDAFALALGAVPPAERPACSRRCCKISPAMTATWIPESWAHRCCSRCWWSTATAISPGTC